MFNYNSEVDVWKTYGKTLENFSRPEIMAYEKELESIESYVFSVLLGAKMEHYSSSNYYVSEIVDKIDNPNNPLTHTKARKFLEDRAKTLTWKIVRGEEDFEDIIVLN